MTTIKHCFDLNQARQCQMALDSAGITSFIPDEISAGVAPFQFFGTSGVRLQVADEDAEEARRVIADEQTSSDPS